MGRKELLEDGGVEGLVFCEAGRGLAAGVVWVWDIFLGVLEGEEGGMLSRRTLFHGSP